MKSQIPSLKEILGLAFSGKTRELDSLDRDEFAGASRRAYIVEVQGFTVVCDIEEGKLKVEAHGFDNDDHPIIFAWTEGGPIRWQAVIRPEI